MIKKILYISCSIICIFGCSENPTKQDEQNEIVFPSEGSYEGSYWPTDAWRSCTPEEVDMDSELLLKSYQYASSSDFNTYSILIIRKGYIVGEAYFNKIEENALLQGYSFAKSFTSAVMGIAIDMDYIQSADNYVYNYLPFWKVSSTSAIKKRVKIKHLLSMTGGLDWNYDSLTVDEFEMHTYSNFVEYVAKKDIIFEPGTHWKYSNGEAILISGVLESQSALNMQVDAFANQTLFSKIGIDNAIWEADNMDHTNTAYGIFMTTRNYAKFGYLFLNNGQWDNQQIISENWIKESTSAFSNEFNHYGYYWWLLPGFENYNQYNIPDSTFFAVGAHGQRICVVPEKDLVVIRMGYDSVDQENLWNTLEFLSLIINSIND